MHIHNNSHSPTFVQADRLISKCYAKFSAFLLKSCHKKQENYLLKIVMTKTPPRTYTRQASTIQSPRKARGLKRAPLKGVLESVPAVLPFTGGSILQIVFLFICNKIFCLKVLIPQGVLKIVHLFLCGVRGKRDQTIKITGNDTSKMVFIATFFVQSRTLSSTVLTAMVM